MAVQCSKPGPRAHSCGPRDSVAEMRQKGRHRANPERWELLSRPPARRLRTLWDEKRDLLPPHRADKLKSALEQEYFMTPEQTEQYFQSVHAQQRLERRVAAQASARRERSARERGLRARQRWLVAFAAHLAYRLCDYLSAAGARRDALVSSRLRAIADVVLERVAQILGERKPSRADGGRLPRFMVAVSDRVAVWIESALYRADTAEDAASSASDEHVAYDAPIKPTPTHT